MKDFVQWLWAVSRFVPAMLYVIIVFVIFYLFVPEPKENSSARDRHHYLDYLDE